MAAVQLRGAPAGVLVPLFQRDSETWTVFTRRRDDLRRHAGEISFPGGRPEPTDDDLVATALREAHEEIGLDPAGVEILGPLEPVETRVTGYVIYPFVATVPDDSVWTPNPTEVAEMIEVSIPRLRAVYAKRIVMIRSLPLRTDTYDVDGKIIWGATARILGDLLRRPDLTGKS